jgi:hypothetical protein
MGIASVQLHDLDDLIRLAIFATATATACRAILGPLATRIKTIPNTTHKCSNGEYCTCDDDDRNDQPLDHNEPYRILNLELIELGPESNAIIIHSNI